MATGRKPKTKIVGNNQSVSMLRKYGIPVDEIKFDVPYVDDIADALIKVERDLLRFGSNTGVCCCGCGGTVSSKKVKFLIGHDSRVRLLMRRAVSGEKVELPAVLLANWRSIAFIANNSQFSKFLTRMEKNP